jgi:hypothetical protein
MLAFLPSDLLLISSFLAFMMHLLLRVAYSPLVSSVPSTFQEICGSPLLVFDELSSRWLSNQSRPEAFLGLAGEAT